MFTKPITFEDLETRERADIFGTYPSSSIAVLILATVSAETRPDLPLITFDTVVGLTPTTWAISFIVTIVYLSPFYKITIFYV